MTDAGCRLRVTSHLPVEINAEPETAAAPESAAITQGAAIRAADECVRSANSVV